MTRPPADPRCSSPRRADRAARDGHRAAREASSPLASDQTTRSATRANDAAAFHDAVWRALTGYFANRLNLQPGEATRDVVLERLQRAGAPADLTAQLGSVFARCEEARFGAGGSTMDAYWDEEHKEIKYQIGEGSSIDQVLGQWHALL